jgi:hypothetical protein
MAFDARIVLRMRGDDAEKPQSCEGHHGACTPLAWRRLAY